MRTTRRRIVGLLLGAMAVPAYAAPRTDTEIADALRVRIDQQKRGTAAVVGLLTPNGRQVVSQGGVGGDSVFEIASLTKVMTALLLADAARRGEVGMDDPLSRYEAGAPSFDGRAITLTDLATHGAGLPLRPPNLQSAPGVFNKYAGYTTEQLRSSLQGYALTRRPGDRFEYSNWGFGLLGDALALRSGRPYDDLLKSRVTGPLGMTSTSLDANASMKARLVPGHDDRLRPLPPTSDGALGPAGGLRSTANDILKLLGLFLGRGPEALTASARAMLAVDRPGDDDRTRMALGWRRTRGAEGDYYWSNGRADGYRAFMGFNPQLGVGVVALIDASSGVGVDDIGRHCLDPASPIDLSARVVHVEVPLPPAQLDLYVGAYEYAPDDRLTLKRDGEMMICEAGNSRLEVRSEGNGRFFFVDLEATLVFSADRTRVELHQDGNVYTYRRIAS